MTNLEYFKTHCSHEADMRYIVRMAERVFKQRGVFDKPVWEREAVLTEWLNEPFDPAALNWAKHPSATSNPTPAVLGNGDAWTPKRMRKVM